MVFSLAKCRLDADILRLRYRDMQLAMAAVADKSQGGISSSRGGRANTFAYSQSCLTRIPSRAFILPSRAGRIANIGDGASIALENHQREIVLPIPEVVSVSIVGCFQSRLRRRVARSFDSLIHGCE